MEPKTGKRMVSKGAYVKMQSKKLWLYVCSLVTILVLFLPFCNHFFWHDYSSSWSSILMLGAMYILWGGNLKSVIKWFQEAQAIDPGVPLTRANTADLPAPESLVRASSEPLQAQQAVLLRAVAEGQETLPEEMLRASAGKE